ncbi:MAG: glycosyltransferase [Pirellulaceae bacterium]|nr:glycosyltransferase [Pirellulaceae bacterium]
MNTLVNDKRVLLISYAFPPTGGAGVQRVTKFIKFLPSYGWRPTVLTACNPSVPVQDRDLLADVSSDVAIIRSRTWEPGYGVKKRLADAPHKRFSVRLLLRSLAMSVLQPDPQILWNATAYRAASRQLSQVAHDAILVTAPPFSSFLLGCRLKKKFGLPLVLDFRDEWALVSRHLENHRPGGLAQLRQQRMRRAALRAADAIIATTQATADELGEECEKVNRQAKSCCIYNGFDPSDIEHLVNTQPSLQRRSTLKIVYTGTLWNLTDVGPLVAALQQASINPNCPTIELHIAGRRTELQNQRLSKLDATNCTTTLYDYLPHQQSLALAMSADLLVVTLADQPGAERVVPAKIFEYMALNKRILAIVPPGETDEILRGYALSSIFHPSESARIADWIAHCCDPSRPLASANRDYSSRYSRVRQAEQLANLLNDV